MIKKKSNKIYLIFGVGYLVFFVIIGIILIHSAYQMPTGGRRVIGYPEIRVLTNPALLYTGIILIIQSFIISIFAFIYGIIKRNEQG